MLEIREAQLSLRQDLEDIFTSGSILPKAFNVYGETEMRDDAHSPARPFIYLMDSWVLFAPRHLPVIAIETDWDTKSFEIGNRDQGICIANLHVFGRNNAERDDLTSAIIKGLTEVHIRDFDTVGHPIIHTSPLIEQAGGRIWIIRSRTVGQEEAFESTLLHWRQLTCQFWVFD